MHMSTPEPIIPAPPGEPELARRKLLLASTVGLGTAGLVLTAVPFVASLEPSERALAEAAPVAVDLAGISPGALRTVAWRGMPVWVLHRTPAMLASLGRHDALLLDPQSAADQQPVYARNRDRSIVPAWFVAVAICTHLGCSPVFRPDAAPADLGPDWPGGFYCPCHGSRYDLAGRVFQNVPAPLNLLVPPYAFHGPGRLVIGEDGPGKLA
ncbi:ubiquinol-cytochrome c reductase iron-sulfur subunit [Massilia terrae]